MDGLDSTRPSGRRSVGTVWLPLLACSTKVAASASVSILISTNGTPARCNWPLSRLQYPHHVVLYIVRVSATASNPFMSCTGSQVSAMQDI